MSEKSFEFQFSADKGRLDKVFDSIYAATKFSSKEPVVIVNDGIVEGFDTSTRSLVPYVRCNPKFFTGEVTGKGYFVLTKTLIEKFTKGFSAGTVTVSGRVVMSKASGAGVQTNGDVSVVGEGTEYSEPVTIPEFPEKVVQSGTQLDYWPSYEPKVERDDAHVIVRLKLNLRASGLMSIQDIAAIPPSKQLAMTFGDSVTISIKEIGKYSKTLPIEYVVKPEKSIEFTVNNKYFKRVIETMEGRALVSVYGLDVKDSAIIFSQKTDDLEYIFIVSGKASGSAQNE